MPEGLHTAAVYCSAWPGVGFQCRCMLRPERLLAQRGQVDGPYGLSEPLRLVLGQLCQQALGQLADAGVDELAGLESIPVVQPPDHSGRLLDAQDVADAFDPTDDPVAGQSFLVGGRPLCPGTRHIPERDLRAVSVKEQPCGFPWQHGASAGMNVMPESPSSHAASLLRHLCSNIFAPLRSPSPYLRSNTSFSLKLLCFSGFARRGRPSLGEAALHLKGWTLHSCLPNEMDISGCHRLPQKSPV